MVFSLVFTAISVQLKNNISSNNEEEEEISRCFNSSVCGGGEKIIALGQNLSRDATPIAINKRCVYSEGIIWTLVLNSARNTHYFCLDCFFQLNTSQ